MGAGELTCLRVETSLGEFFYGYSLNAMKGIEFYGTKTAFLLSLGQKMENGRARYTDCKAGHISVGGWGLLPMPRYNGRSRVLGIGKANGWVLLETLIVDDILRTPPSRNGSRTVGGEVD